MKILTLMRHAKSDWGTAAADVNRPLNARGEQAARVMAERMARRWQQGLWSGAAAPQRLVSSPALRARTTAELMAAALAQTLGQDRRLYPFVGSQVAAVIGELPESLQHVMLFGHNPGISQLATALGAEQVEMPTAAIMSLQFEVQTWPQLLASKALRVDYDFPKNG